ncbi:hypothetical protein FB446DRAFT_648241 [Lentinula raphanica]|nr:hypothetical protein EV360DRAFT_55728 [Lentinula raphanica]KAJ3769670.1 hypothetical protein FB446DRAFT_648241 [Lentinula raphanica]
MCGNYRFIPSAQKEIILKLSRDHRAAQISKMLQVSPQTVSRVLRHVNDFGDVPRTPRRSGRPRILNILDVMILESFIERTPDITLFELQVQLEAQCTIWVAQSIILRALNERGWTRKKVCVYIFIAYSSVSHVPLLFS